VVRGVLRLPDRIAHAAARAPDVAMVAIHATGRRPRAHRWVGDTDGAE
jgi:hypothetical protein